MTTAAQLYREALQLSPADRELLAQQLHDSLEKEPGYDEAWSREIERRIDDLRLGRSVPIELTDDLDIFGDGHD